MATGYQHRLYAEAVSDGATAIELARSGGSILRRPIPGTPWSDATGPYPLFSCRDWSQLTRDVEELGDGLVSIALVADPFADRDPRELREAGWTVEPFKDHQIVELDRPAAEVISRQHRQQVRRALRAVEVERVEPREWGEDWAGLYAGLVRRHAIEGPAAFSDESLRKQLEVPGLTMFRASAGGETVGINLWFRQGPTAYYHLGASSDEGYRLSASYALMWTAIEHFAGVVDVLNLGAGPGLGQRAGGLTRFKSRWATGSRTAYFLSRILDAGRYEELAGAKASSYFPAYR